MTTTWHEIAVMILLVFLLFVAVTWVSAPHNPDKDTDNE